MINVNQITAQLARMPDNMLQQFAAMHKTDPYTLSLALSESNRRKEMRQSAQMGQQQPQPKVVDQELAQMAQPMPEDMGIGQLPAPNMQNMLPMPANERTRWPPSRLVRRPRGKSPRRVSQIITGINAKAERKNTTSLRP